MFILGSYLYGVVSYIPYTLRYTGSIKCFLKLIPLFLVYLGLALVYNSEIYGPYKLLFCVQASALFGILSVWMIICNTTAIKYQIIRADVLIYVVYALLTYFGSEKFNSYELHLFVALAYLLYMSYFFCALARELSNHLDIPMFSVKQKKDN